MLRGEHLNTGVVITFLFLRQNTTAKATYRIVLFEVYGVIGLESIVIIDFTVLEATMLIIQEKTVIHGLTQW